MDLLVSKLSEILELSREFKSDYTSNEQAVRDHLVNPILNALGWNIFNPKFVKPNAPNEDGKIPDYTLFKNGKSTLVVEAKNLSIELKDDKIIAQIATYCYKPGIEFGILTNGIRWLLFNTFQKNPEERIVWIADLEKESTEAVGRKLQSFSYNNIDKLNSLIQASKILESIWDKLVKNIDDVVNLVSSKMIEKINYEYPKSGLDITEIKSFTKGKLIDFFEDYFETEQEDDTEKDTDLNIKQEENEFLEVEQFIFKKGKKAPRIKIRVIFPDGSIIQNRKVKDTFVEVIKKIGIEKVKTLGLYQNGIPLIDDKKNDFYSQEQAAPNCFIMTHSSTPDKENHLRKISSMLNVDYKIERIDDYNN